MDDKEKPSPSKDVQEDESLDPKTKTLNIIADQQKQILSELKALREG